MSDFAGKIWILESWVSAGFKHINLSDWKLKYLRVRLWSISPRETLKENWKVEMKQLWMNFQAVLWGKTATLLLCFHPYHKEMVVATLTHCKRVRDHILKQAEWVEIGGKLVKRDLLTVHASIEGISKQHLKKQQTETMQEREGNTIPMGKGHPARPAQVTPAHPSRL